MGDKYERFQMYNLMEYFVTLCGDLKIYSYSFPLRLPSVSFQWATLKERDPLEFQARICFFSIILMIQI